MSTTTQPATSWHRGRVAGWIISVDHKRVGALYLAWAAVFLLIGGILPLLMRIQMTKPDAGFLGDSTYAGMRTMHGTLLVFFVLVPVVVGLATYLVPLMIGADRIEKPGLAAMSLWLFGFGGAAVVLSAFAKGGSSEAGWAGYPPVAITQEGHGVDLWLIGMILLALSVLASAANLVATIQMRRAEGMTWPNLPVFAWSVLVWGFVSLVLVPLAALGLVLILLERRYPGTFDFFLTDDNEVKPWLTWLFGQSFAYAALVPVLGVLAEVVAVFGGRAMANAKLLGQALVAYAGLTFVLVLYHAYAGAEGRIRASCCSSLRSSPRFPPSSRSPSSPGRSGAPARASAGAHRWSSPAGRSCSSPSASSPPSCSSCSGRAATCVARPSGAPTRTTSSGARGSWRCSRR